MSKRPGNQAQDFETAKLKGLNAGTRPFTRSALLELEDFFLGNGLKFWIYPQGPKGCPNVAQQDLLKGLSSCSIRDENEPLVDAGTNSNQNTSSDYNSLYPYSLSKPGENSESRKAGNKRGRGHDPPDDDQGKKRLPSSPSPRVSSSDDEPLFACPTHAHVRNSSSCHGFRRIVDVRQHINRKHMQKLHCPTCGSPFGTREDRDAHINQLRCQASAIPVYYDGVTQEKWEAMRLRAKDKSQRSEDERWYEIWDILYPGVQRPPSTRVLATEESRMRIHNSASKYSDGSAFQTIIDDNIDNQFEESGRIQMENYLRVVGIRILHGFCDYFLQHEGDVGHTTELQSMHGAHSPAVALPDSLSSSYININPTIQVSAVDNAHGAPGMDSTVVVPGTISPNLLVYDNTYQSRAEKDEIMR